MDRTTRETTMLKTAAIVMVLLLCSTGLARPFVGAFASGNYVTNTEADPLVVSLGAQAGVHNLLGLFGARGTLELSVYPDFALAGSFPNGTNYHLTEVAGDALFSLGLLGVTGYAGVGGGVGRIFDAGAVQARAVAGVELAGVFVEGLPTLWLQTGTGTVLFDLRARAGYNFGF